MSSEITVNATPVPSSAVKAQAVAQASAIESFVLKGDISAMPPEQKASYYIDLCQRWELDPSTCPIEFILMQGKLVPYVRKVGTDQIARKQRLTRETIFGPEVVKIGEASVVMCKVKVTAPDGRSEVSTATVPLKDPSNDFMKAETKAKRRATLSIHGLGLLDESELETMSGFTRVSLADALGENRALQAQAQSAREKDLADRVAALVSRVDAASGREAMHGLVADATALGLAQGSQHHKVIAAALARLQARTKEAAK
jgi:hypothetical protein